MDFQKILGVLTQPLEQVHKIFHKALAPDAVCSRFGPDSDLCAVARACEADDIKCLDALKDLSKESIATLLKEFEDTALPHAVCPPLEKAVHSARQCRRLDVLKAYVLHLWVQNKLLPELGAYCSKHGYPEVHSGSLQCSYNSAKAILCGPNKPWWAWQFWVSVLFALVVGILVGRCASRA